MGEDWRILMFPMKRFRKKNKEESSVHTKESVLEFPIPHHVAIIMDGNGRWAKQRAMPRVAGHHEGMKVVRKIALCANEIGVNVLTLYAFSTENWTRPKREVDFLMKLPEEFLGMFLDELVEKNMQIRSIGDNSQLPKGTFVAINKAMERTKGNNGLILNFALNYGGRTEIIEATKQIAVSLSNGEIKEDEINEELFSSYLMTKTLPDPDLLIRTSGEIRLSNFMLWQLAYSEFLFSDRLWPDFTEEHFIQAIGEFQQRHRRFGGVE